MVDYSDLVMLALRAALKAKDEILDIYENKFDVEIKGDGTPLTIADKNANKAIVSVLNKAGLPIVSEESRLLPYEGRKSTGHLWLVDPLDGTKEFIKKNGEFTINIGLINKSEPVIGITALPVSNIIYLGWKGQGAFKINISEDLDKSIINKDINSILRSSERLPENKNDGTVVVAISRSHSDENTDRLIELLMNKGIETSIVKKGSALKFGLIAEGTADIYIRGSYSYEWDTASGHALVNAAGGKVLSVTNGKALEYNKQHLKNDPFIAVASENLLKVISGKLTF